MGLESGTFVNDLVTTNPVGTDAKSQGDDHLRLIKALLKTTFPNASKAFRFPTVLSKTANYTVAAADDNALVTMDATGGSRTIDLLAAATAGAGFLLQLVKIDSSGNSVTVDPNGGELINGATTLSFTDQYDGAIIFCDGSEWFALAIPQSAGVPSTRTLTAGTGLSGGGDLSANRTFNLDSATDSAIGGLEKAIQSEMEAASDTDRAVVPGRVNFHPGVAKCLAHVTYSGGVPTLESGSRNMTSITDDGVGLLTTTWATDFSAATYFVGGKGSAAANSHWQVLNTTQLVGACSYTIYNPTSGGNADPTIFEVIAHGDH